MSQRCQITGKGPRVGHNVSHAHNLTKRKFHVNLQKVRVWVDGRSVTMRVSTHAIRSGFISKPPIKHHPIKERALKPSAGPLPEVRAYQEVESGERGFFTTKSVADLIFRPPQPASGGSGGTEPNRQSSETPSDSSGSHSEEGV